MNSDAFVSVKSVGKVFKSNTSEVIALDQVSIDINAGEIVSIVGPSGCGKTTVLRMLAGLERPSTGSILVEKSDPIEYSRNNGIGFVFQKPLLFEWRTVISNILLPTEIRSSESDEVHRKSAQELFASLGLSGFEDVYPKQLSGGMLQRASLARALLLKPNLLLLDEPFSALDEITREQLWADFHELWRQQNLTVLLVTHSIREAVFLSDRVLTMSKRPGRILNQFDINVPDKRDHKFTTKPEFTQQCETIRKKLQQ